MALASETSTLDGFAPTTAILDEWHEAKTRKTYNVIKSGMTQQKNGLLCVISTAGLDLNVPMYEEYLLLDRVLKGEEQADRYFIAIWELTIPKKFTIKRNGSKPIRFLKVKKSKSNDSNHSR